MINTLIGRRNFHNFEKQNKGQLPFRSEASVKSQKIQKKKEKLKNEKI
jgi:hypothetical protein